MAQRVLKQLSTDEGESFPLAAPILLDNFYVDDGLFGAHDIPTAPSTRDQLIELMNRSGFQLRKWSNNSPELLSDLSTDDHMLACDKELKSDESIKVLGLAWVPAHDVYKFVFRRERAPVWTKRSVLSVIARMFDPLGLLAPVVIRAKIFMQTLWQEDLDWETSLTAPLQSY